MLLSPLLSTPTAALCSRVRLFSGRAGSYHFSTVFLRKPDPQLSSTLPVRALSSVRPLFHSGNESHGNRRKTSGWERNRQHHNRRILSFATIVGGLSASSPQSPDDIDEESLIPLEWSGETSSILDAGVLEEEEPLQQSLWTLLVTSWGDALLLLGAVGATILSVMVNMQIRTVLSQLTTELAKPGALSEGSSLIKAAAPVLILFGLKSIASVMHLGLLTSYVERFVARLRFAMYGSLIRKDVAFYDSHSVGELLEGLSSDVESVRVLVKQSIMRGFRNTLVLAFSLVEIFSISPQLTLGLLSVVPVLLGVGRTVFTNEFRRLRRAIRESQEQAAGQAQQTLSCLHTVRAFGTEDIEALKYGSLTGGEPEERMGWVLGLFNGASHLASHSVVLLVAWWGMGVLTPDELARFLLAALSIQGGLNKLSLFAGEVTKGMASANRVNWLLNEANSEDFTAERALLSRSQLKSLSDDFLYRSAPEHRWWQESFGSRESGFPMPAPRPQSILFSHVSFAYPLRPDVTVLDNLTLEIPLGGITALVGASGSGKSTLGALLMRYYNPEQGRVLVCGRDLATLSPEELQAWRHEALGVVNQSPVLFSGSIRDNITYGRGPISQSAVEKSARQANAHDFIIQLPEGYDTHVSNLLLSGGQKQRIALARVCLKQSPFNLWDEATSALDPFAERQVQQALDSVIQEDKMRRNQPGADLGGLPPTTVVIAHRLSTIRNADKIVVMDKGRVVETGTHEELMKIPQGFYREMVEQQRITTPVGEDGAE